MLGGLSMRTASLIFRSVSWLFLGTTIRCSSTCFGPLVVGLRTTWREEQLRYNCVHVRGQQRALTPSHKRLIFWILEPAAKSVQGAAEEGIQAQNLLALI